MTAPATNRKSVSKSFGVNDFVFAKVKGYPPWPARVHEVKHGNVYKVVFYGTNETGNIKISELWSYFAKKDSFINDKTCRNPDFLKGTIEIRKAIDENPNLNQEASSPKVTEAKPIRTPTPKKVTEISKSPAKSPTPKKVSGANVSKSPLVDTSAKKPTTPGKGATKRHHNSEISPVASKRMNSGTPSSASPKANETNLTDENQFLRKIVLLYENFSGNVSADTMLPIIEDLLEISYTEPMLRRNHGGISLILRLRKFSPYEPVTKKKCSILEEKAKKIRAKADFLFKKMCKILSVSEEDIWKKFSE